MKIIKPNFWRTNNIIVYLLYPLSLLTKIYNSLKRNNFSYEPKIKSICVGNIYLGGTGKTQIVIKLNEILKKNYKPIIIKKYYKNQKDEQMLLQKKRKSNTVK